MSWNIVENGKEYICRFVGESGQHRAIYERTEHEPIVRCRECKFYHEVVGVVDSSELLAKKCCWYFDTWANEVNPDGFCAWGKSRSEYTRAERTCIAESHDCGDGITGLYCSVCGNYIDENDNYCPNCGARMVSE